MTYRVPLSASGWTIVDLGDAPMSAEQFRTVLQNLTGLHIRGDFKAAVDTGSLDDVEFGAG